MKVILLLVFLLFLINKDRVKASSNNKLILIVENGLVKRVFDDKENTDCTNNRLECVGKREDRTQHKLKDFIKKSFQRQIKLAKLKDLLTMRY